MIQCFFLPNSLLIFIAILSACETGEASVLQVSNSGLKKLTPESSSDGLIFDWIPGGGPPDPPTASLHALLWLCTPSFIIYWSSKVGSILRNGTERNGMERNGTEWNGMERNDGLNCGTERFLNLKLAGYHCLPVPTQVISSPSSKWLNINRHNWKIDCGFLLVAISNEVVGFVGWVMINVGYSNKETHRMINTYGRLIFHTLTSVAEL